MTLELPEDIGHEPGPLLQDTAACVWTDLLVSLFFFWRSRPYQPACLCGLGESNGCRINMSSHYLSMVNWTWLSKLITIPSFICSTHTNLFDLGVGGKLELVSKVWGRGRLDMCWGAPRPAFVSTVVINLFEINVVLITRCCYYLLLLFTSYYSLLATYLRVVLLSKPQLNLT